MKFENFNQVKAEVEKGRGLLYDYYRTRKIANNTYLVEYADRIGLRLHDTDVIDYYPGYLLLHTGGWRTVTTKDRINRGLPPRVNVQQEDFIWYLMTRHGGEEDTRRPFEDCMAVDWYGRATVPLTEEDISFEYNHSGYMMKYRGQNIGGAGPLEPARKTKGNLDHNLQMAEITKHDLLAGNLGRFREAILRIAEGSTDNES